MSRCIVVVPTYNEAENLPLLVPAVLAQDERLEVLVVDDDSPDGTGKCADDLALANPRVHVLHRAQKQGLGPAYRAGIPHALELGADCVVQMDADFSHPPAMLATMLAEIERYDVVSGSRYLDGITVVNWPIERILISYFGNAYVRRVTGLAITDTTGGFRCMRRELFERIGIERVRANGYAFQIELNYRFARAGARVKEIPFFFVDRRRGASKLTWQIGLEALWIALRLRIADALGLPANRPRVRILILNERDPRHPRAGGAETHVHEVFGRLAARGHAVTRVVSSFAGGAARDEIDAIRFERDRAAAHLLPARRRALRARDAPRRVRRGGRVPEQAALPRAALLRAARARAVPPPVRRHRVPRRSRGRSRRPSWRSSARSRAPIGARRSSRSPRARATTSSRAACPRRRSRCSIPGSAAPTRRARRSREREPLVVYVGRLEAYKRIELVLEAVARLAPRQPGRPARAARARRGARAARAPRRGARDPRPRRVRGLRLRCRARRWLARARVCVCASRKEGFGLTVIEANALGTPNVASDAPGLRDTVRHGETGFLVAGAATGRFAERDRRAARRRRAGRAHVARGARVVAALRLGARRGGHGALAGARRGIRRMIRPR